MYAIVVCLRGVYYTITVGKYPQQYTFSMIGLLTSNITLFILGSVALILAITFHEYAHAWMAVKLGDPTPKFQKRLTLNPLAHLDPLGTLLLFLVGFGWGKPVQFDPYNLENPRKDTALVSLAGPVSNIILATIASIFFWVSNNVFPLPISVEFIFIFIRMNLVLALFNLVPVHPLDGGKILVGLLPPHEARELDRFLNQYGMFILLILVFPIFGTSPVFTILNPAINFLLQIYLPGLHFT